MSISYELSSCFPSGGVSVGKFRCVISATYGVVNERVHHNDAIGMG